MARQHDLEIPEDWEVDRYEKTGLGRLLACFRCSHTGWKLNIVPYRSYELPDSHRITLTKDDSMELIAEGPEVKQPEKAVEVALEQMEEIE